MTVSMIITAVLMGLGLLFMLASLLGIARFPDFFARLHAQGVGDTLGAFLMLAGMMVAVGANLLSVKILLIFIIIVLTNPIGTNLMMIAAINKEDYQGYSTFMSSGAGKAEMPETPAEDAANNEDISSGNESEKEDRPAVGISEKDGVAADNAPKTENKAPETADKAPKKEKKSGRKAGRRKPSMNMNKTELLSAAEERGIEVPEGATKREILDLIYSNHDKNRI